MNDQQTITERFAVRVDPDATAGESVLDSLADLLTAESDTAVSQPPGRLEGAGNPPKKESLAE